MQAQFLRLANDLHSCIQTVMTPESSCRPLPWFCGFGGPTSAMRSVVHLQEVPKIAQGRAIYALNQELRKASPTYPRLGERRRLAVMCLGLTRGRTATTRGRAATSSRRDGTPFPAGGRI